ncbi:hypothetical protein L596_014463 [Steinernema carpocapsae]|uniref:PPIase cyclophilin-type domain-containing protein n=1 Tax=Steinernema carpocapsae TaxID=34508 RepID=A0A4U5NCT0_STECR|nr:hypothetical protein L596_014463 [Steinernema carpocapsae]
MSIRSQRHLQTKHNFLALCASNYYNDCIFHRNIKDFMVQTGDPTGTGKGGESIWGEPFQDELDPELKHDCRGILSMANNGPDSNKSQFFICYAKHPHLDLKNTVFGKKKVRLSTVSTPSTNLKTPKSITNTDPWLSSASRMLRFTQIRSLIRQLSNFTQFYQPTSFNVAGLSVVRSFSTPSVPKDEDDVDMKRVEQMQKYFNQYVEEYYEVEEADEEVEEANEEEAEDKLKKEEVERRHMDEATVAEIVGVLEENRAINITCVDIPLEAKAPHRHMIICSPFNSRHAEALTNIVRRYAKANFYFEDTPPRRLKTNGGWFVFDMRLIVIHVLTEQLRAKYALETLWSSEEPRGEDVDDMIPPPVNDRA